MDYTSCLCPGCNAAFSPDCTHPVCPQCGQTLSSLGTAATLQLGDMQARNMARSTPEPEEADDHLLGHSIGIYNVEGYLGRGGMARVYRALHRMLQRPCALKVLNPRLVLFNPDYVHMFLSEARVAASLVHPHVVTIHTIGYEEDEGVHYLEMEYVLGRSLAEVLAATPQLELEEATRYMVEISSALAAAHGVNLIHRDIKPGNVLVTSRGVAKLADFGLAKRVATGEELAGRQISGTPYFMAPELFAGEPASKGSDVYAMGVTYYHLLTNKWPYAGKSVQDLAALHERAPIPDVRELRPEVPAAIAAIVQRCLEKSPSQRFADAEELHRELSAVYGCVRDLGGLLREALADLPVLCSGSQNHYRVVVSLPHGRRQTVHVDCCESTALATPVVRIYSPCGPAQASFFQRALEMNASLPHAAIALEARHGQPYFVMNNSYPRATCDVEEIRESVLLIARHADEVEMLLTGGDEH